jgi:class 3 adenylate cyclase
MTVFRELALAARDVAARAVAPGRAVRCALALGSASKQPALPLRAGLHTGEIAIGGQDIGGIVVPETRK